MRVRWVNVLLAIAAVAGSFWVLTHRGAVPEWRDRLIRMFEVNPEWEPVFVLMGAAVVLALAVRILRDSNTGGGA